MCIRDRLLGPPAFGERGLDVVDHAVERGAHPTGLAAGVGVTLRDPGEGGDVSAVQRGAGDLGGGGIDPAERAQLTPDHHRAAPVRSMPLIIRWTSAIGSPVSTRIPSPSSTATR